jgi:hypothetical protein
MESMKPEGGASDILDLRGPEYFLLGSEILTGHSEVFSMFVFRCENSEAFIYSEAAF